MVKLKKEYGQNLLISKPLIKKVVSLTEPQTNQTIIEIGPGTGNITKELLKSYRKVIVIEKDPEMIYELEKIKSDKLKIIEGDALKITQTLPFGYDKIFGALPYNQSKKFMLALAPIKVPQYYILQKEFVNKLIAEPKESEYGFISVYVNLYTIPIKLLDIPKENFKPIPKVDSSFIKLIPRNNTPLNNINNKELFFQFLKEIFNHKNQNMKKILKHLSNTLPPQKHIKSIPLKRPREMDIYEIINLYLEIFES